MFNSYQNGVGVLVWGIPFFWSCRYTKIEHNLLENVVFLSDFPPARHYSSTIIPGLYVQAVAVQLNHTPQYRFYIIQEEKIVIEVVKLHCYFFFSLKLLLLLHLGPDPGNQIYAQLPNVSLQIKSLQENHSCGGRACWAEADATEVSLLWSRGACIWLCMLPWADAGAPVMEPTEQD